MQEDTSHTPFAQEGFNEIIERWRSWVRDPRSLIRLQRGASANILPLGEAPTPRWCLHAVYSLAMLRWCSRFAREDTYRNTARENYLTLRNRLDRLRQDTAYADAFDSARRMAAGGPLPEYVTDEERSLVLSEMDSLLGIPNEHAKLAARLLAADTSDPMSLPAVHAMLHPRHYQKGFRTFESAVRTALLPKQRRAQPPHPAARAVALIRNAHGGVYPGDTVRSLSAALDANRAARSKAPAPTFEAILAEYEALIAARGR